MCLLITNSVFDRVLGATNVQIIFLIGYIFLSFFNVKLKKVLEVFLQNLLSERSNRVGVNPCGVCNRRNCIRGAILRGRQCGAVL